MLQGPADACKSYASLFSTHPAPLPGGESLYSATLYKFTLPLSLLPYHHLTTSLYLSLLPYPLSLHFSRFTFHFFIKLHNFNPVLYILMLFIYLSGSIKEDIQGK